MFKIFKYLKGSFFTIFIIVILLCIQAMASLALPDYTSKIVDVGIQAGGIENPTPEVIRESQMETLLMFTDDDTKILENYALISKNNLSTDQYEEYIEKYPEFKNQNLYIQDELNKEEQNQLNELMVKPLIALSMMQNAETMQQIPLDMTQEQIDSIESGLLEQVAIAAIKAEYEAIGVDLEQLQNKYLIITGIEMLGVSLIVMITAVFIGLLSARVAAKLGKTLRNRTFKKVLSFGTKEFSEFSVASLITRSTNDIQQVQNLISMLFRAVVFAPIMGIGALIKVLTTSDGSMAWIIGLAVTLIITIAGTLFVIAMPKFKKLQTLIDKINQVSREILTGLPVIRAFNTENKEQKRFDGANLDLTKANIFINRIMSTMMPAMILVMNGIMILIIWVGGKNVDAGVMQVGDMMALLQYTMHIVFSFLMISMISVMLPRAAVSARRINEILDTKNSITDPEKSKKFDKNKKGLVEFKNVSFRYPDADEEVLTDINFTAEPGKTTAIIGSTGSGKSTIVNLLPRFYDVTGGELCIDGVNIKEVAQKDLRDIIGIVPQKGVLFSGTIESNIKYSNENMSDEIMTKAAEIAQATEFINEKENKYKDKIAQGGSNVSGGQKQRLSIARAIAKDPEIFIFDDSFSALDLKTDRRLRETLSTTTKNKTVIIVAQRISTILNADKIIVLEEGKIVGQGSHTELMKTCETYKSIALSQLSEEELKQEGSDN